MKLAWLVGGHVSVALAALGVVLPLLPTTPFLLLASFCYSRGSERFERWLLAHGTFGPPVRAWRERRAVSPRAKVVAAIALASSAALMVASSTMPAAGKATVVLSLAAVGAYVLSRPSR